MPAEGLGECELSIEETFVETYSIKLVRSEKDFAVPLTDPEKTKISILRLVLRDKFV